MYCVVEWIKNCGNLIGDFRMYWLDVFFWDCYELSEVIVVVDF